MINFILRSAFAKIYRSNTLKLILAFIFLFLLTLYIIPRVEPPDSSLNDPLNIFYFFIVTVSTVGYGDMSPETVPGKVFAVFLIICGLGLFASAISFIAEWYIDLGEKRRKGKVKIKTSNHLVILYYRGEETRELVGELRKDPRWAKTPIVLAADIPDGLNPMEDLGVGFVNGDPAKERFLQMASVAEARAVFIDAPQDVITFAATFAVQKINNSI